ncbi:beta-ketoacyl-ACP synthase II [Mucilaginibacter sp. 14171R-50]|uniref:beta-ketoacyl-ACP synthase II n=1 Tax=Mucilaginibacter sp. 14171R-50 TaxID=2703789 RepID=UPI00138BEFBE|nr:beta-ketoacyl-ACP synthase II [Mucilaginibacter sp. 14171R-50]QHS55966.1 beta-ketoacyl-ACP synthase II [Mucilaginibacter sp. 14171R-50]
MNRLHRVAVTGLGVLAPSGNDLNTFWKNIVGGKSTAALIRRFNPGLFRTRFACQLSDFNPAEHLDQHTLKRSDLFTQFALVATDQAINDSGFDIERLSPFDVGVIWGSGQGGMGVFEQQVTEYAEGGKIPRFSPFFVPKLISNMSSAMISIRHGLMGINYTTVSACATANTAIMDAFNYIRLGKAKIIITGASEAPVTEASIGGFCAMKAMSLQNDDPLHASRPFDISRDGFVMGEGAGALVLEEYEHARKRGAFIYGELTGAAMTADAYHITATHPEGAGAAKAMKIALKEAGVSIGDVDYLNAHGTSTPVGDLSEIRAIKSLAGPANLKTFISSTKSMTGHLLGAAGAIEAVICLLAMRDQIVPPTINTVTIDPQIPPDLKIVLKEAVKEKLKVVLSNTFGFGGHNASLVFTSV